MKRFSLEKPDLILLTILFSAIITFAQSWNQSEYSDVVGELFFSARSSALSGSDLAVSHSGPLLYNPANLGRDIGNGLTLTYSNVYKSLFNTSMLNYYTSAGDKGGLGVTLAYLHVSSEDTRNIDISNINTDDLIIFSNSDIWFRIGYGLSHEFWDMELFYGAAINARRRRLQETMGYGMGLDAGAVLNSAEYGVSVGMMVENITGSYVHWSSQYREYSLPHIRLSVAWEREFPYIYGKVLLGYTSPDLLSNEGINAGWGEGESPRQVAISEEPGIMLRAARVGLEYEIMETVAIRAGVHRGDPSFGGGLALFNKRLSTDFTYITHHLAGSWKISVTYNHQ